MGKVVVSEFMTVDGVVEDPGGAEGFARGGWALQFDRGPEGDRFKTDELMASDALLLGRRTYLAFAEAWPARTGDFADKFNSMPKYVASATLALPRWGETTVFRGELPTAVARLKDRYEGDILVNGSIDLVRALLGAGLVDELRLMVFPVLLGAGKRFYGDDAMSTGLQLVDSRPAAETLILTYRPISSASEPRPDVNG